MDFRERDARSLRDRLRSQQRGLVDEQWNPDHHGRLGSLDNGWFSWDGNGTINFPYDTEKAVVPHPSKLNVIPRPSLREVVRLLK